MCDVRLPLILFALTSVFYTLTHQHMLTSTHTISKFLRYISINNRFSFSSILGQVFLPLSPPSQKRQKTWPSLSGPFSSSSCHPRLSHTHTRAVTHTQVIIHFSHVIKKRNRSRFRFAIFTTSVFYCILLLFSIPA